MNKNTTFSNVTQKIVLEDEVHIISEALGYHDSAQN
ncbi:hypothetical protein J2S21_000818 [Peribacillus cavernae]|nr:hypothetical protein [Peribacillus cavernae]